MVHFCKFNKVPQIKDAIVIDSHVTLEELPKCCSTSKTLIFTDITKNFRITNKGGRRMIDFIKTLSGYPIEIYLTYNPSSFNYLINTESTKLASPTESRATSLFIKLTTDDVDQFRYSDNQLVPEVFTNSTSMFNWLVQYEPILSIQVINGMKERKASDPDFLEKDIITFSNDFPAIHDISNRYSFDEADVAKAFSTILSI